MVIAVSGKGGTGKSTISALVVRYLLAQRATPVLVVDADPNSTLGEKLGIAARQTIGDLREGMQERKYDAPSDTPKQRTVEFEIQQAIEEGNGFDFLAMGRGEGSGCYCSINNMLRTFLHDLTSSYAHVVIDNEAGMEHLSRRTNDKVSLMLMIGDSTPTGLKSAKTIAELARKHEVVSGEMGLVVNRLGDYPPSPALLADTGLALLGYIPDDPRVHEFEQCGRSLLELPADSAAVVAVSAMLAGLGY